MEKAVSIKNLTVQYPDSPAPALVDINLEISKGERVGIIGRSNSGKTTLLRCLNGLIPHVIPCMMQGSVTVTGVDVSTSQPAEMAAKVGLVFEDPEIQIVAPTVAEDLCFGPINLGLTRNEIERRLAYALEATRLTDKVKRNPMTLSGGEKQSLAIGGVLAMLPRVLALDEPISALDPVGKERVISVLRSLSDQDKEVCILVTEGGSNAELLVPLVDRVIVLDKGRITHDDTRDEVLSSRALLDSEVISFPPLAELSIKMGLPKGISSVGEAVSYLKPYVAEHRQDFQQSAQSPARAAGQPMVVVSNLHHVYPPAVRALNGVNITINEGDFVAIIGQNGSGKTTLAYHLAGLLKPTNADPRVEIEGKEVTKMQTRELRRHLSYVFQNPRDQFFKETVSEELAYGLFRQGNSSEQVASNLQAFAKQFNLENLLPLNVRQLSRSEASIVALFSIAIMRPKVMIVDEPGIGTDEFEAEKIYSQLKQLNQSGMTIVVITHDMKRALESASRTVVMAGGQILADGPTRDIFAQTEMLARASVRAPTVVELTQEIEAETGLKMWARSIGELCDLLSVRVAN